jgi:hypothetical protein
MQSCNVPRGVHHFKCNFPKWNQALQVSVGYSYMDISLTMINHVIDFSNTRKQSHGVPNTCYRQIQIFNYIYAVWPVVRTSEVRIKTTQITCICVDRRKGLFVIWLYDYLCFIVINRKGLGVRQVPDLGFEKSPVCIMTCRPNWVYLNICNFPQALQVNTVILPLIRTVLFPHMSLQIYYTTRPSLYVTWCSITFGSDAVVLNNLSHPSQELCILRRMFRGCKVKRPFHLFLGLNMFFIYSHICS